MEKHKKFRCLYFYLNCFFRLSPMYYLFTFISYKFSVHFGQGPMWYSLDYHTCANSWWYNIFYLNNAIPMLDMCMVATWHIIISVDMRAVVHFLTNFHSATVSLTALWVDCYNTGNDCSIHGSWPWGLCQQRMVIGSQLLLTHDLWINLMDCTFNPITE